MTELGNDDSLPKIEKIHSSMFAFLHYVYNNESPRFSPGLGLKCSFLCLESLDPEFGIPTKVPDMK